MAKAYLSLGSNQSPESHLARALDELRHRFGALKKRFGIVMKNFTVGKDREDGGSGLKDNLRVGQGTNLVAISFRKRIGNFIFNLFNIDSAQRITYARRWHLRKTLRRKREAKENKYFCTGRHIPIFRCLGQTSILF